MKKGKTSTDGMEQVNGFMDKLEHPLKAEVNMLRQIIKNVNKDITEQVKWNAPSFSYKGQYLVTFNLRPMDHIHLVFHNPMISKVQSKLLEGEYKDRRMAYFTGTKDIQAKRSTLEKALKDLIKFQKE
ncbi:MAG TPA: DUF1801 domain-containing protein [Anaerolineales bacterium]|nr:DUF1801 domain-containing protein [Anaerolineales bacterium]